MEAIMFVLAILLILSWIWLVFLLKDRNRMNYFMKEIIRSSKKFKKIDFETNFNKADYSNFSRFVSDYNKMIRMIEDSHDELKGKNLQLNSILKSVSNGVLVIDVENNIFLMNDKAKIYLKCPLENIVERKPIQEVINDEKILKFILHNINLDKNITKELRLTDGKIYRIKIDPISIESRKTIMIASVVNIEDITDRMKLENMRRDFAANVSHELKTPLTSIQGFIETLKENNDKISPEIRLRFLDIIDDESKRLRMLINDILLLSSIEGDDILHYEEIDFDVMSKRLYGLLLNKLQNRNVELIIENKITISDDSKIYLPKYYFEELLLNLITNGIKYNKENGFVKVFIDKDDTNYYVHVIDNGIGIPTYEQERIFERFYRVDKARNKGIEGTGLGLAIVKHIVISLGGKIELKSEIGRGSEFKITLPIYKTVEKNEKGNK